jgi:hypothetical protein
MNGTSHCRVNAGTAAEETPAAVATAAHAALAPKLLSIQGAATAAAPEQHDDLPQLVDTAAPQAAAATLDNAGLGVSADDPAADRLEGAVSSNSVKAAAGMYWPKPGKLLINKTPGSLLKGVTLRWRAVDTRPNKIYKYFEVERRIGTQPVEQVPYVLLGTVDCVGFRKYMYTDSTVRSGSGAARELYSYRVRGCSKRSDVVVGCSDYSNVVTVWLE